MNNPRKMTGLGLTQEQWGRILKVSNYGAYSSGAGPADPYPANTPPKLGWFNRWFMRKSQWAWEMAQNSNKIRHDNIVSTRSSESLTSSAGLRFQVYAASGGHVIEFTRYDIPKDRSIHGLHLIPDGADFATELGKIVMLEVLRS